MEEREECTDLFLSEENVPAWAESQRMVQIV